MTEPRIPLSAVAEPVLVFDGEGNLVSMNDAARAQHVDELRSSWEPVVDLARRQGTARDVLVDAAGDRTLVATARRQEDGRIVLLLVDARQAVATERTPLVTLLLHELRNVAFGVTATLGDLAETEAGHGLQETSDRLTRLAGALEEWIEPASEIRAEYSLGLLVAEVVERVHAEHPAASFRIDAPHDARAIGRRARIGRALQLVLQNAVKHAPPGSTIDVRLRAGTELHTIGVRDAGVGLPRGAAQSVWSPLFRRTKGGVGMGLAIARRFVIDDGGSVHADAAPGGGALFTLAVPSA